MVQIYKLIRSTAWLLVAATLAILFSGVLMTKSFLLSAAGYNIVYHIHKDVVFFIFIPLFFFHGISGLFILIARYPAINTKHVKTAAAAAWTGLFVLFAMIYIAENPAGDANGIFASGFQSGANSSGILGNANSTSIALSASEIGKHNSASDCWFIISGKVYDVTSYLPYHPGGAGAITTYCGADATDAFATKGESKPHSPGAYDMLASYYVGDFGAAVSKNTIAEVSSSAANQNTGTSGRTFENDD